MADYEWLEKNGTKILFMHIASGNEDELREKLEQFSRVIRAQPAQSLLTISDVTNGHFDRAMKKLLQDFVQANTPYIKKSAIIGVGGLQKVVYNGVIRATGRKNLVVKKSLEDALAFLISSD